MFRLPQIPPPPPPTPSTTPTPPYIAYCFWDCHKFYIPSVHSNTAWDLQLTMMLSPTYPHAYFSWYPINVSVYLIAQL